MANAIIFSFSLWNNFILSGKFQKVREEPHTPFSLIYTLLTFCHICFKSFSPSWYKYSSFFFFSWSTWEQITLIKPLPSESFSLYFLRTKSLLCNNGKVVKVRKLNINKYSYLQLVFKFFQLVLHRLFFSWIRIQCKHIYLIDLSYFFSLLSSGTGSYPFFVFHHINGFEEYRAVML